MIIEEQILFVVVKTLLSEANLTVMLLLLPTPKLLKCWNLIQIVGLGNFAVADETTTATNNVNDLGRYSLSRVGYGGNQNGTVTSVDDTLSGMVFFEFHQDLLDDTGSIGLNYGLYGMVGKDNGTPCVKGVEIPNVIWTEHYEASDLRNVYDNLVNADPEMKYSMEPTASNGRVGYLQYDMEDFDNIKYSSALITDDASVIEFCVRVATVLTRTGGLVAYHDTRFSVGLSYVGVFSTDMRVQNPTEEERIAVAMRQFVCGNCNDIVDQLGQSETIQQAYIRGIAARLGIESSTINISFVPLNDACPATCSRRQRELGDILSLSQKERFLQSSGKKEMAMIVELPAATVDDTITQESLGEELVAAVVESQDEIAQAIQDDPTVEAVVQFDEIASITVPPTFAPTAAPTLRPTRSPDSDPVPPPTPLRTAPPTLVRTMDPTANQSAMPTLKPTAITTANPAPTVPLPTDIPAPDPTLAPRDEPTLNPIRDEPLPTTVAPVLVPTVPAPVPIVTTNPVKNPTAAPNPVTIPTVSQPILPTIPPVPSPTTQPLPTNPPILPPTGQPLQTTPPVLRPTRLPKKSAKKSKKGKGGYVFDPAFAPKNKSTKSSKLKKNKGKKGKKYLKIHEKKSPKDNLKDAITKVTKKNEKRSKKNKVWTRIRGRGRNYNFNNSDNSSDNSNNGTGFSWQNTRPKIGIGSNIINAIQDRTNSLQTPSEQLYTPYNLREPPYTPNP